MTAIVDIVGREILDSRAIQRSKSMSRWRTARAAARRFSVHQLARTGHRATRRRNHYLGKG
jgi:hypothetical protein